MKTIFTCLFVSVALLGFGQQNTFKVGAYAPDYGYMNQMIQLNDGSFVGVGENFYSDYEDTGYLLKTDAGGNVLAYQTIPTTGGANAITKTNDGGFAVCGGESGIVQLIKFKADLTIEWEKNYSTDDFTKINKMIQSADGSFVLVGAYSDPDRSRLTAFAIKTDAAGTLQFAKRYVGFAVSDRAEIDLVDVVATTDGNYALAGESSYYDGNGNDLPDSAYIIKINPAGDVLWLQATYSNIAQQSIDPYRMTATSDGGLVIAGDLFTPADFSSRMGMIKYNNAGTLLWSKSVGPNNPGTTDIYGDGVIEDKDGGYLFYGALDVYNDDDDTEYAYIAKTNAAGTLQWTKSYYPHVSSSYYAEFYDMIKTSDGGYAVCGDGDFFYPNQNDYYESGFIFKLDQNFKTCDDSIASEGTLKNGFVSIPLTATVEDIPTTTTDVSISLHEGGETRLICSGTALPLQLLSFNATLQNKSVAVQWTTANEVNTSSFTVERSNNAVAFKALQTVPAKGNNAGVQTYNTTDLQPLSGTSYYRLKEVDKDGKVTYSSVVPVTVLSNGVVVISPNPVRDVVRVVMQSTANASVTCQVIDMRGTVLATQKTSVTTGRNELTIPAASLAKGVYVLKVIENNATQTIRFVKE